MNIPTYEECEHKHDFNLPMTKLEIFIYENEPVENAETWRNNLIELIRDALKRS